VRRLAAIIAFALIAGVLALPAPGTLLAQESPDCAVTDLGTLSEGGTALEAVGRWTTEECDSRFRSGSDAHTYRFQVAEAGRIRVDLMSAGADSYLYLLAEDGSRIADDDDGGANLDARVEGDLMPGVYMIEATTVGGRSRGPADFAISVSRVSGCEPVHLGALEPGTDLTASGSWTLDTCGSRFVVEHPAHGYSFILEQAGRVRIDLTSEDGDPVLSLASLPGGVIGANDDGGDIRNARIERYLPAGFYFIEATTYLERDYQPLRADFSLTVRLVDEQAEQARGKLKIEDVHTPAEVVAGDPFPVHYRAGNLGGDLAAGGYAVLYVIGRHVFERTGRVAGIWQAGVYYHAGQETASGVSTAVDDLDPFEVSLRHPGPSWVFVAVVTFDAYGDETGFQGLWHNLMVLGGPTYGPVDVRVDGETYTVAAEADDEGQVTTSVVSAADPAAEVDPMVRSRAIYTAGVQTQLLDGVFERPGIEPLAEGAVPAPVTVSDLSTAALVEAFAHRYVSAAEASGMSEAWAAGEALNPIAIEESILETAGTASAQYASMATSWRSLQGLIEWGGKKLSFEEALRVQAQVGYAESVVAAAVTAGEIVEAARASDDGWEDPDVRAMIAGAGCRPGANALGDALETVGADGIDELLALDAEMRALRPVHGLAVDGALCAVETVNTANLRFLRRLSISSPELQTSLGLGKLPASSPEPQRPRIIARLGEDGRLEHGVEFAGGERVLPPQRFLRADGPAGSWQVSGDVEVGGTAIGRIRARPVANGRFELGFVGADGEVIVPGIRYLPADLPEGVWFRSSEIEVPVATVMDAASTAEE
jgi:hypothetical protein